MKKSNNNQVCKRGFTLIEVMVALSIAAVGLGAIAKSMYQNIDVADRLSEKMLATWVASDHMAKIHIERKYLASGGDSDSAEMGGREWRIDADYSPTDNTELSRVDISVYPAEGSVERVSAKLFGFVAQPLP